MYSSFFAGSYGLKFLNGESTAAPAGLDTGPAAALDVVFIFCCAESLDFLAGDFWFRAAVVVVAVRFACALGRASGPADALALGAGALAFDFALAAEVARAALEPGAVVLFDPGLAAALPLPGLALAEDLSAALAFLAGAFFFAGDLLAEAAFAEAAFAAVFEGDFFEVDVFLEADVFFEADIFFDPAFFAGEVFAEGAFAEEVLAEVLAAAFTACFFLGAALAELPLAAGLRLADFFFGAPCACPDAFAPALTFPLEADLPAALARGRGGVFSVGVAAMILLWFLTRMSRPRTADAGISKGA